ncbi:MAG: serine hydrolase [Chitinophagaceae bacterium]
MNRGFVILSLCLPLLITCHPIKKTGAPPVTEAVIVIPEIPAVAHQPPASMNKTDALLEELLQSQPEHFAGILAGRDSLRVQIIYTQIDRQANNDPVFTPFYFNVNEDNYFYPASTVKMPVALLALQRLNELKVFGLNSNSIMITESGFSGQTPVYNDPSTADGSPSIAHYIRKIFLVSDNDAFNRLYEFLGPHYINDKLHKMDYSNAEILHRLSVPLTEEENRHTNPIRFITRPGDTLYSQPMQVNTEIYSSRTDSIGEGYMTKDGLAEQPMDFSKKNRIGLADLSGMLKSIIFPSSVPQKQRFNLQPDEYRFVWQYMSQYPGETLYPFYDTSYYRDAYAKFLMYGSGQGGLPKNIRVFNKVGNAYGFLTDVAYVADFEKNIEFMLSATIYCNSDGVLNDDKYDYETIGFPFLKNLGRMIYDYELTRQRLIQPDLSAFILKYDK